MMSIGEWDEQEQRWRMTASGWERIAADLVEGLRRLRPEMWKAMTETERLRLEIATHRYMLAKYEGFTE